MNTVTGCVVCGVECITIQTGTEERADCVGTVVITPTVVSQTLVYIYVCICDTVIEKKIQMWVL